MGLFAPKVSKQAPITFSQPDKLIQQTAGHDSFLNAKSGRNSTSYADDTSAASDATVTTQGMDD
jgi:hypothetical protein